MNEMKRRVAAILEFVGRMQGEGQAHIQGQGGQGANSNSRSSEGGSGSGGTPNNGGTNTNGNVSGLPTAMASSLVQAVELAIGKGVVGGGVGSMVVVEDSGAGGGGTITATGKEFREMGSGEMMETLTRELIGWQNVFGRYGEK
jgi:hypothetical protein